MGEEVILELFLEIFGEGFITISSCFIPEKLLKTKAGDVLKVFFAALSLVFLFSLVIGVALLVEGFVKVGLGLVIAFAVYAVLSVTLYIIGKIKRKGE